jgi:DHA2 family multidrug resistance protein
LSGAAASAAAPPVRSPYLTALAVTLATFMEILDTNVANVSLPHIAGNLAASLEESTWILTSYLVANAVVLPLSGWLSSVFGRKRFYMGCVVLFTGTSFLCGLAPNLTMLIIFRILQGMGGGGLQPSEQAILVDTFPPEKRGMGMAVYAVAVVVAPVIGPTLGGWITDNYSWRWIFFINVPVGILSLILTSRLVHDPPGMERTKLRGLRHFDYVGISLVALGLGSFEYVMDKGQREDWFDSRLIIVMFTIAIAGIVAAVVWELLQKEPVVDFRLLRDRHFGVATLMMFILGFALYGSTVLLPLFLQQLLGYTAYDAGMVLSPGGLVVMGMNVVMGFLLMKVEARKLVAAGFAIIAYSLWRMSQFDLTIDYWTAATARMVQAGGLAFLFVPINTIAFHFLPPEKSNRATGLINLARNMGGSVGIAVVTTLLERRAQLHQTMLLRHLTPFDEEYRRALAGAKSALVAQGAAPWDAGEKALRLVYRLLVEQANVLSYIDNFRMLAAFCIAAIPIIFFMRRVEPGKGAMVH